MRALTRSGEAGAAAADRVIAELEHLALRARIDAQRRIQRTLTPWGVPIAGRETRVERAWLDSIEREELAKRRPQAERIVRKFGRQFGRAELPGSVALLLGGVS